MNHIVLYEPEIPQNTGNIMRTCAAVNMKLHLIKPLGFELDIKHVKRSAANYLEHVDYKVYDNYEDFVSKNKGTYYFITRYGQTAPDEKNYSNKEEEIYFIFGRESSGIPKEILAPHFDNCLRLPMAEVVRSLNLSNTVAIVAYECMRQQGYPNLYNKEPDSLKGADFLLK